MDRRTDGWTDIPADLRMAKVKVTTCRTDNVDKAAKGGRC